MGAEEYAEEDKKVKEKIDARNEFESNIYSVKSAVAEKDKWEGKISEEEKDAVDEAVKEAMDWLDDNQEADKEDFEEKKAEFSAAVQETMTKIHSASSESSDESADN